MPNKTKIGQHMWSPEEILHGSRTNPKYFWTERRMRLYVNTQPEKHKWNETNTDVRPVLNNIAAAAHACNIFKNNWVHQCFEAPNDAICFLDFLEKYKGHINSYWFYALLGIIEVAEEEVSTASAIAQKLKWHATETGQLNIKQITPQKQLQEHGTPTNHTIQTTQTANTDVHAKIKLPSDSNNITLPSIASFTWIKDWLD